MWLKNEIWSVISGMIGFEFDVKMKFCFIFQIKEGRILFSTYLTK